MNDAKIEVIITRPNTHDYDIKLNNPDVKDGVYSFTEVKLPKAGRWNVMAKISVGDNYRFYNLKSDTRYTNITEY